MLGRRRDLLRDMFRASMDDVRAAYIERVRAERGAADDLGDYVPVEAEGQITADGREVIYVKGKAYALHPDVHARWLARRMVEEQARQTAPTQLPSTCPAVFDKVQLCGGNLTLTRVCPNCALGKSGVAATLTCDVCGHVTAVMREVSHV